MRNLTPDEAQLWAKVTASIRPLSRAVSKAKVADPVQVESGRDKAPASFDFARAERKVAVKPAPPPPAPRPGTTLDGSWDRKLDKGAISPDRILDLHGHTLDAAWHAIDRALEQAIADGDRVLLLVTGHERRGAPPVERGKIRAAVGDWLAVSRHARKIAAVRGAHPRHGGGGSLYIILRRG